MSSASSIINARRSISRFKKKSLLFSLYRDLFYKSRVLLYKKSLPLLTWSRHTRNEKGDSSRRGEEIVLSLSRYGYAK